ncbi:MAG: helix-turn-helix transcriptional regulator [Gammaproteobacteria bacterium]|nr:helix-turn-helix transcriptional regulator [Gammaproteobacteria bacterium]
MSKCNIRNRIHELRAASGDMTQQALADAIGVTRQTVVAIEKEKYSPSLEVAFRIAATFDVPLDEVFRHDP